MRHGSLLCANPGCRSEYPIIDSTPILVADLRRYIAENVFPILARDDLPQDTESLIGDCCGPGSAFDSQRQHLSTYACDHFGDLDPEAPQPDRQQAGSMARLLKELLPPLSPLPPGPVLDLGCSVGRSAFELAAETAGPVLGIDLNFAMLRLARAVRDQGIARYPKRRIGIVYQRRQHPARFPHAARTDFWVADATNLPFADGGIGALFSLNLLDCVPDPYRHLQEIARLLRPNGKALLASPFDWTQGATAMEGWIGGHSQRAETAGAAEPLLRSLLTPGSHPQGIKALELLNEPREMTWTLRLHDRSTMRYQVHAVSLQKPGANPARPSSNRDG